MALAARLRENKAAMEQVRVSEIVFSSGAVPAPPARIELEDEAASSLAENEAASSFAEISRAADRGGAAEVERLRAELAAANARAETIAACQRRETEIRMTLLEAAHEAASAARDEAVAEAAVLKRAAGEAEAAAAECRAFYEVREATWAAEAGLLAAERDAANHELVGRRGGLGGGRAATASGVHLAVLREELEACECVAAARSAFALPSGPPAPAAFRELCDEVRLWASPPPEAVEGGAAGGGEGARNQRVLERLARLESVADTVAGRFDALQGEHGALRAEHEALLERLAANIAAHPQLSCVLADA